MNMLANRFNKRIMAIALSVVMAASNMTAYASENADTDLMLQINETAEEVGADLENRIEDETQIYLSEDESETINSEEKEFLEIENSTDSGETTPIQNNTEDNREQEFIKTTGAIIGLDEDALNAVKIIFEKPEDRDYEPEVTIDVSEASYEAELESGVVYTIKTEGINDYQLDDRVENNGDTIAAMEDEQRDIIYTEKTTYPVTIEPIGATLEDLAKAKFAFTNLDEEGYEYIFDGTDNIALRNGRYSVEVSDSGRYVQQFTSDLVVDGEAVTKQIPFEPDAVETEPESEIAESESETESFIEAESESDSEIEESEDLQEEEYVSFEDEDNSTNEDNFENGILENESDLQYNDEPESEKDIEGDEGIEAEEGIEEKESLENENSLEEEDGLEVQEDAENEEGLVITFADTNIYEYTGAAIKPDIRVKNNGKELTEGIDYTVKYSNNVNVPTGTTANRQPRVTVTGKGAFSGSTSANFRITRKDINAEDVIKGRIVVVQGKKVPVPAIYYGSVKLTAKDFSYNKETVFNTTGNTTLAITGTGNFRGSAVVDVAVVENAAAQKENAKKFSVTIDKVKANQLIYTGENLEEALRGCIRVNAKDSAKTNLTANAAENYRIVFPKDITNAGTVKFTVVGIGAYSGCDVTKTCKILPRTVQNGDILINGDGTKVAADGKIMISGTQSATAFSSSGATFADLRLQYGSMDLKEGKDYKVSYSGNKSVADGKAKYTISFMGNFKGKYTSPNFNITKAELSEKTADSVVLPDQVCSGADGVYKSNAYVSVNGVTLKASEYEVRYYTDAERTQEMTRNNPVKLSNGTATVYVKIIPSEKGNYTLSDEKDAVKSSYTVWTKGDKARDLSKAKVTFYDAQGRKVTKVDYSGKPVRPARIVVTVGGVDFASDAADAPYTYEIVNNTNKGKASVVIKAKAGSGYTGGKTASFSVASRSIKDLLFKEIPRDPAGKGKILIAYFSWSNTTERMAQFIQEQTGGDLYEIVPVTPYPTEYTPTTEVAREERDKNARPTIKDLPESISEYDRILIGYPIWWHTAPMIIGTFLEAYDLSGVDIYPFTQSASMDVGQFNQSMQFVRECAPGAVVHDGLFARATDTAAITTYLTENGLTKESEEAPTEPEQPTEPEEPTEPEQPADESKTLVVYFSWSNNTRRMAEFIQSQTGGDLYEIVPVTPYPEEYTPTTEVAKEEVDNNARPAIKDLPESISEYDRILIGYPIWWHTAPMIIGTFLEAYDLSGVDIYPFTQSASMNVGQFEQSMEFIRECAPGAVVHDGLFTRATNTAAITAYLTENELIKENGEEPQGQIWKGAGYYYE